MAQQPSQELASADPTKGVPENLYTRAMLEEAFGEFHDVRIVEEELEMHEDASHAGLSAVIGMTAWK